MGFSGWSTTPILFSMRYLHLLGLVFPWACPWRCSAVDDRRLRRRLLCCRVHSSYQLNSLLGELELEGFPREVCFCHKFSLVLFLPFNRQHKQCLLLCVNLIFCLCCKKREDFRSLENYTKLFEYMFAFHFVIKYAFISSSNLSDVWHSCIAFIILSDSNWLLI